MSYRTSDPTFYNHNKTFYFRYFFPVYSDESDVNFEKFLSTIEVPKINQDTKTFEYGLFDVDNHTFICKHIYYALKREYYNTDVLFSTPEEFMDAFANKFVDMYLRIEKQMNYISKIYNLTDDEITLVNKSINNASNNDNEIIESTEDPLNFISSQIYNINWSDKLTAYLKAIDSMPELKVSEIIEHFRPLFNNIYNKEVYYYED